MDKSIWRFALLVIIALLASGCFGDDYKKDIEVDGDTGGNVDGDEDVNLDGDGEIEGEDSDGDIEDGDLEDEDDIDGDTEDGEDELETEEEVEEEREPQIVSDQFSVRASVEQIHIWSAPVEVEMEILDVDDNIVATAFTDDLGSLVFRKLAPAKDYYARLKDTPEEYTNQLDIMSVEGSLPDDSFYSDQILEPGFGYLTTRDGTKLSIFVSLPGPVEDGPYPTLVNYSGYSPSKPGESLGGDAELFCTDFPVLCDAPSHPFGIIGGVMGYATVGVNIRGTGCSGGAYDYFEPLQLLDGYDVIEIVASQSWVKHNKVGMVGLSYPGITQLFVASTNPPSLLSIAPFSVLADSVSSTLLPGGMVNEGFAINWIDNVMNKALPYAHGWIQDLVDDGDTVCEENQLLHSQLVDVIAKAREDPFYDDDRAKPIDPTSFVHKVDVPVFLVGQSQDEQTGPHFPALFDKFTNSPVTRFTMTNGVHPDGIAPQVLARWFDFTSIYVDQEVPQMNAVVAILLPMFMEQVFSVSGMKFPPMIYEDYTSFDDVVQHYEAQDPIRVIYETGAAEGLDAGAPQGTFEKRYSAWPIPETVVTRYYFHNDGSMTLTAPTEDNGYSEFEHDPEAGNRVYLVSGSIDKPQPNYDYKPLLEDKAIVFLGETLTDDVVMTGPGSADIWLKSDADDADLEVNITEVRNDGKEVYIQSGWLRASHRTMREEASELRPVSSHYEEDVEPLVADEWNLVRIEIMPMGHVFREGSKIRVSIDTPGDSRARWKFGLLEYDTNPSHYVAHNKDYPSSIVLPVIPDIEVPESVPACNAYRGQPCRDYVEYTNTTTVIE